MTGNTPQPQPSGNEPHYPYQATPHGWVTPIPGTSQHRWTCDRCGLGGGGYDTQDEAMAAFGKHGAEMDLQGTSTGRLVQLWGVTDGLHDRRVEVRCRCICRVGRRAAVRHSDVPVGVDPRVAHEVSRYAFDDEVSLFHAICPARISSQLVPAK